MSRTAKRLRYVLKRLLQAIPIVLMIVIVNFFLLHMAEGDAVDVLAGEAGSATPEYMAELRAKFGLDQPLPVQLFVYLKNVLSFDLGYSFRHEMPVANLFEMNFLTVFDSKLKGHDASGLGAYGSFVDTYFEK